VSDVKKIRVAPIERKAADECVRRWHYSGKTVNNSQLHLGVFLDGRLLGAMQFGPSLDKRKIQGLVTDTPWNGFLELNRMAFSDELPRNSESRCLAIAMRLMRKHAPHVQWIVSFADGAQCGDGTIYRASGFLLTGIRRNTSLWVSPGDTQEVFSRVSLTDNSSKTQQQRALQTVSRTTVTKGIHAALANGGASMKAYKEMGFRPIEGYQLRYLYFLDPSARQRLTVPILPFNMIDGAGARMYRGQRAGTSTPRGAPEGVGGATPTPALR
jgi:hypothetical protein